MKRRVIICNWYHSLSYRCRWIGVLVKSMSEWRNLSGGRTILHVRVQGVHAWGPLRRYGIHMDIDLYFSHFFQKRVCFNHVRTQVWRLKTFLLLDLLAAMNTPCANQNFLDFKWSFSLEKLYTDTPYGES